MTIEVTKTVPSCFEMIRGLIATTMGRYPVGVGTVWDPGAVREAKDAGASFVVTPVVLPEVADACREEDILCVLGALTPTEIYQARLSGATLVKIFPITPVGGPRYIEALNGPLGGVPFWVSGGVPIDDIGAYLRLGVKVVGLSGSLFPEEARSGPRGRRPRRAATRPLAPHVVAAHRGGDVRVEIHHLGARQQQRDDHDERHQRKDQGELDHALGGLFRRKAAQHPTW